MADLNNVLTHAGHTVILYLGTEQIGRAQTANARRTFGTQGVYEIGTIMPVEHIPLRYEGTVTLDRFFIRKTASDVNVSSTSLRTMLKILGTKFDNGLSANAPATDEDIIMRTGLLNISVHEAYFDKQSPTEGASSSGAANLVKAIGRVAVASGRVIRAYLGCTLADYSEVFRANALAGENATFFFLDCLDAADTSVTSSQAVFNLNTTEADL